MYTNINLKILYMFFLFFISFTQANCLDGIVILEEDTKSIESYHEINKLLNSAINLNDNDAFYQLGELYIDENFIKKDYELAVCFFKSSALLGNTKAKQKLEDLLAEGEKIEEALQKGAKWLVAMSESMGSRDLIIQSRELLKFIHNVEKATKNVELQFLIANIYETLGEFSSAIKWYTAAMQQDLKEAYGALARLYYLGSGTKKDIGKALDLYHQGANIGDIGSIVNLGIIYVNSDDLEDKMKAKDLFEKAIILSGDNEAYLGLGGIYEEGVIVDQDMEKALEFYLKAAEGGDAIAQLVLGEIAQEQGEIKKALYWYQRSCNSGEIEACNILKGIK